MSTLQLNYAGELVRQHADHPTTPAFDRWQEKIEESTTQFFEGSPCWNWTGCVSKATGYGQFKLDGRRAINQKISPHVFAYVHYRGDVPSGQKVFQRCQNRVCCNPDHLAAKARRKPKARVHF
jgi:hypothetical protein